MLAQQGGGLPSRQIRNFVAGLIRQFAIPAGLDADYRSVSLISGMPSFVFDYEDPLFGSYAVELATVIPVFKVAKLAELKQVADAARATTVLGKFPDYIKLADELGAKRFNIPT